MMLMSCFGFGGRFFDRCWGFLPGFRLPPAAQPDRARRSARGPGDVGGARRARRDGGASGTDRRVKVLRVEFGRSRTPNSTRRTLTEEGPLLARGPAGSDRTRYLGQCRSCRSSMNTRMKRCRKLKLVAAEVKNSVVQETWNPSSLKM